MVRDDLQVRIVVHDLGEHEPCHRGRGLVGPAERPPDLVERLLLVDVVGHLGAARRMQPDRLAELVHLVPERQVLRPIERLAGDVGVDLHAERAGLDGPLRFRHPGVRRIERDLRHPAREVVLLLRAQLGEAIVDDADQLIDLRRTLGEFLDRGLRIRQDLLIVLVAIYDLLADIDVVDRRQRAHALAHVLVVAGHVLHLVEEFFREEVRIRVDPHLRSSNCSCRVDGAAPRARGDGSSGGVLPPCEKRVHAAGTRGRRHSAATRIVGC